MPKDFVEDGYRLGGWAADQRTAHAAGRLSEERTARLEALPGWDWNFYDAAWEKRFLLLDRYAARERHSSLPKGWIEDGYRLGQWVNTQRAWHAKGRLSAARTTRLEALLGWTWTPDEAAWGEGFSILERFVARTGHARVSQGHVEDSYRLGSWVDRQRAFYRAGRLVDERAVRLDALPGWVWNPQDDAWEEGYPILARYASREGHARVPAQCIEDGYRLGKWVTTQRTAHRVGRLSADRTASLEAVQGWTIAAQEAPSTTSLNL